MWKILLNKFKLNQKYNIKSHCKKSKKLQKNQKVHILKQKLK